MDAGRETNTKVLCVLSTMLLVLSSASSTVTKGVAPSELESMILGKQNETSAGMDHYTDEPLTGVLERRGGSWRTCQQHMPDANDRRPQ